MKFITKTMILSLSLFGIAFSSPGATKLAGHWRLDTATKEKVADLTEANPSGSLDAAPGNTPPQVLPGSNSEKGGVEFNGMDKAWVRLPIVALKDTQNFTLELWFQWDGSEEATQYILGNASGVVIMVRRDGQIRALLGKRPAGEDVWAYVELPGKIEKGQPAHLMLRVDDGVMQLVVKIRDELRQSSKTSKGGTWDFDWKFTSLGINPYDKESRFKGCISAVKIYTGALTDSEFLDSIP